MDMAFNIIIGILLILLVIAICGLIFSLYMYSMPLNKQDEVWDNLQNKFINFWK